MDMHMDMHREREEEMYKYSATEPTQHGNAR